MLVWLLVRFTLHSMNGVKLPTNTVALDQDDCLSAFARGFGLTLDATNQPFKRGAARFECGLPSSRVGHRHARNSAAHPGWRRALGNPQSAERRGARFRDVIAFDAKTALILSSGTGQASRIYLTNNEGLNWTLVLTNPDQTGFFDAIKFGIGSMAFCSAIP